MVRIDILNQPEQEEDVAPPLGILSVQARGPRALCLHLVHVIQEDWLRCCTMLMLFVTKLAPVSPA